MGRAKKEKVLTTGAGIDVHQDWIVNKQLYVDRRLY